MKQRTVLSRLSLWPLPSDWQPAPSRAPARRLSSAISRESDQRRCPARLRSGFAIRSRKQSTSLVSHPFQVNHYSTDNTHDVARVRTDVLVPCSRGHPHFVVLQQIGVDKHTQLSAASERGRADFGFGNPRGRCSTNSPSSIRSTTLAAKHPLGDQIRPSMA
jgi:hypothetical protein